MFAKKHNYSRKTARLQQFYDHNRIMTVDLRLQSLNYSHKLPVYISFMTEVMFLSNQW